MKLLRVSKTTSISSLAGAIAHRIRKGEDVELSMVGSQTINLALKAIMAARRYLQSDDNPSDIVIMPEFCYHNEQSSIEETRPITSLVFRVFKCPFKEEYRVPENPNRTVDNSEASE